MGDYPDSSLKAPTEPVGNARCIRCLMRQLILQGVAVFLNLRLLVRNFP